MSPEGSSTAAAPSEPSADALGQETAAPVAYVTETDKPTAIVRYGSMGLLGRFISAADQRRCGQRVVIKSDRGQEIGTIVCAWGGCGSPAAVSPQIRGEVLRATTHADEVEERHLRDSERREFQYAKSCIGQRGLPMKLVSVEHLFGGDRIVFYFVSESRVDFRALVRDLAHEFQTRIEMRQIGVRDEARLLGDYERCGRPLCCRAWIKELEPVSMKMAKIQKATLDPTKISGRCGRLMCCLRFEHTTYRDLARNLPRKNTLVMTTEGRAKVIDTDVVSQMVGVLLEKTGARVSVPVESLLERDVLASAPARAPEDAEETAPEMVAEREAPPEAAAPPAPPAPPADVEPPPEPQAVRPDVQQESPAQSRPQAPQPGPAQGQEHRGRRGRRRSRRGGRNRGRPGPGGPGGTPPAAGGQGGAPPPGPSQGNRDNRPPNDT